MRDLFQQDTMNKKDRKRDSATNAILKGLEATFALLSERSSGTTRRGRHRLDDRIVREVLTTAIMMAVPDDVTINSLKAVLGDKVDWAALRKGLDRAAAF